MPQLVKPLIGTIIQESPKYGKVILLDTNSTDGYLYNYTKYAILDKIEFQNLLKLSREDWTIWGERQ